MQPIVQGKENRAKGLRRRLAKPSLHTVAERPIPSPAAELAALPDPGPVIEVAAGLVFRSGRVLITQRLPGGHLAGLWEFPGGKREAGESYEQCLRRELREELAIEVEPGELVDSITHHYPEKSVHLKFYHCVWEAGEPQPIGCGAVAWVSPSELARYEFPAADARLLALLQDRADLWR